VWLIGDQNKIRLLYKLCCGQTTSNFLVFRLNILNYLKFVRLDYSENITSYTSRDAQNLRGASSPERLCFVQRRLTVHSIRNIYNLLDGPGSSVGIATDYGLDGPGSNPGGDEIFCSSRPALGPTQPPVQWVPGLPQGQRRPRREAEPPSHLSAEDPRKE